MKKIICLLIFLNSINFIYSQRTGISYQALILNSYAEELPGYNNPRSPLVNKDICLEFAIIDDTNSTEYTETQTVRTDAYGMVNLIIGTGNQVGGSANSWKDIVWNEKSKKLKVSLDVKAACSNFIQISVQELTAVPFALYSPHEQQIYLIKPSNEGSGFKCPNGGVKIEFGLDTNSNLILDNFEIDQHLTKYVCNGDDGMNSLVRTKVEAAGSNCANGGIKIEIGPDNNGNDTLDDNEVNRNLTKYVCNGAAAVNTLIRTKVEAAGSNCANGGIKIEIGPDNNGNDTLDDNEVNSNLTKYICDGAAGNSPKKTLISTKTESAGSNCANGGTKIEVGTDSNGNDTLDNDEIDSSLTKYICNGVGGTAAVNTLIRTKVEAAGSNCANGGIKIEIGPDNNGNDTLDDNEVNSNLTKYICDGAAGNSPKKTLISTKTESAGSNCANGGTKIEVGTDSNGNDTLDNDEIDSSLTKYICNGTDGTDATASSGVWASIDPFVYKDVWVSYIQLDNNGKTFIIGHQGMAGSTGVGTYKGSVKVFEFNGGVMEQIGQTITDGVTTNSISSGFGEKLSIGNNGKRIVVNAATNSFVYDLVNNSWNLSHTLPKISPYRSLWMSNDGNAIGYDGHGLNIYRFDGTTWSLISSDVTVDIVDGWTLGNSVKTTAYNSDATIIAKASSNYTDPGQVVVYKYDGTNWSQLGQKVVGDTDDRIGTHISISDDGLTFMTGGMTSTSGQYYHAVYKLINDVWTKTGTLPYFTGGMGILNNDGNELVIKYDSPIERKTIVSYKWNGSQWNRFGSEIPFGDNDQYQYNLRHALQLMSYENGNWAVVTYLADAGGNYEYVLKYKQNK